MKWRAVIILLAGMGAGLILFSGALEAGPVQFYKTGEPAAGVVLVAAPSLKDPHFRETVVLIVKHDPHGTFGLVVNRPTGTPLSELWPQMGELRTRQARLFLGGPVEPQAFGLLYMGQGGTGVASPVFDDVFFSQNRDDLALLLKGPRKGNAPFRVFAGYAGWAPGQLQAELQGGSWFMFRGEPEGLFEADPGTIWEELIKKSEQNWVRIRSEAPSAPDGA